MTTYNREQEYGLLSDITPSWLCITKRQTKEGRPLQAYRVQNKINNIGNNPITIMNDTGIKYSFNSYGEAGKFMGYNSTHCSAVRQAVERRDKNGWFTANRKRYKFIK